MDEKPKRRGCLKTIALLLVILFVIAAALVWWRQGVLDVRVDEAKIAALPKPAAGEPVEFTCCTYNVQARPWFDDAVHKFQYISPLMNNHDIVAIQECFKQHDLLFANAKHPVKVYHGTFRHPLKIVGSGLALLGKFPLVKVESKNYDALGEFQNWPASKGIVMARFDVGGMMVDVYNTHIEAGGSPEALAAKVGQGDEIIEFVREHSPAEHTVIFMGDFNMRPSLNAEDKEKNKDNPRVFTFDKIVEQLQLGDASVDINGSTREDIDRVLYRPGTGVKMETVSWQKDGPEYYDPAKKPLSDHEPVMVRFRMQRS